MKEVLLVGPIRSSEAAPEADADIEQGAKTAVYHEDDAKDWVGDALRFCVWGLAVGVSYAPVEDWAEDQSSYYSGGVTAGHKNIINVWSFIYQKDVIKAEEMEGKVFVAEQRCIIVLIIEIKIRIDGLVFFPGPILHKPTWSPTHSNPTYMLP